MTAPSPRSQARYSSLSISPLLWYQRPLVYPILEEAAVGIHNAVILTSGFSEMGARGQEMEQAVLNLPG